MNLKLSTFGEAKDLYEKFLSCFREEVKNIGNEILKILKPITKDENDPQNSPKNFLAFLRLLY